MIKSLLYHRYNFLPLLIPLRIFINISGQHLMLVVYHTIGDEVPDHIRHLYLPRSIKTFSDDMNYLLKYFEPIGLPELTDMVTKHQKPKKNQFLVSFDDGLSEFYSNAAPILKRMDIPATCFLNTAFIDNRDMFYRYKVSLLIEGIQKHKENPEFWKDFHALRERYGIPGGYYRTVLLDLDHTAIPFINVAAEMIGIDFADYLKTRKPYLTSGQIRELTGQGFTFGGHSIDHLNFSLLPEEESIKQAVHSTGKVAELYNLNYKIFAFPFTDFGLGKSFFEALYAHDQVELSFGSAGLKHDSEYRNLQRIPMEEFGLTAERRLKTDYFYYLLKAIVGKNTIKR